MTLLASTWLIYYTLVILDVGQTVDYHDLLALYCGGALLLADEV